MGEGGAVEQGGARLLHQSVLLNRDYCKRDASSSGEAEDNKGTSKNHSGKRTRTHRSQTNNSVGVADDGTAAQKSSYFTYGEASLKQMLKPGICVIESVSLKRREGAGKEPKVGDAWIENIAWCEVARRRALRRGKLAKRGRRGGGGLLQAVNGESEKSLKEGAENGQGVGKPYCEG